MASEYIKTCPNCGGSSCLTQSYSYKSRLYFAYVKCSICGAQGKVFASKEEPAAEDWDNEACNGAIDAWNMRTGANNDEDKDF